MHKKLLLPALIGATFATSAFAEDAPPASPWSFNVGVVSDYLFRGVSQTHGGAALQGGVDFTHPSGFYVGAWGSTITWVKDNWGSGSTEVDLYGGYRGNFTPDWTYDVGLITYNYPGHGNSVPNVNANPNTAEVYGAIGYKWLSAKYSYAVSSHFIGWAGNSNLPGLYDQDTRGSDYLELNANYDMGNGWTLIGHVGHQKVKNYVGTPFLEDADYTDWKVGVSKDVGFGVVTLYYSTTNAKGSCGNPFPAAGASSYCWGNGGTVEGVNTATNGFKDVAKGTAVLTFLKTF